LPAENGKGKRELLQPRADQSRFEEQIQAIFSTFSQLVFSIHSDHFS